MDKKIKKKKHHQNEQTIDPNYRIPIIPLYMDDIDIKKTTFPTTAFEAGALNISQTIELKKRSVINKPDSEFYKKYYEVKIETDKPKIHKKHHHKHSNHTDINK